MIQLQPRSTLFPYTTLFRSRKNKDELSEFVQFFLKKSNEELDKSVETVSEEAWKVLYDYPWPGNIRELKNTIKRAVLMAKSKIIKKDDLPQEIIHPDIFYWNKNKGSNVKGKPTDSLLLKDVTAAAEKQAIIRVLSLSNNNKTKAAEVLGIDRKTLYNKLNAYGLLEE